MALAQRPCRDGGPRAKFNPLILPLQSSLFRLAASPVSAISKLLLGTWEDATSAISAGHVYHVAAGQCQIGGAVPKFSAWPPPLGLPPSSLLMARTHVLRLFYKKHNDQHTVHVLINAIIRTNSSWASTHILKLKKHSLCMPKSR